MLYDLHLTFYTFARVVAQVPTVAIVPEQMVKIHLDAIFAVQVIGFVLAPTVQRNIRIVAPFKHVFLRTIVEANPKHCSIRVLPQLSWYEVSFSVAMDTDQVGVKFPTGSSGTCPVQWWRIRHEFVAKVLETNPANGTVWKKKGFRTDLLMVSDLPFQLFHSQEWSISNFSCSLTRNITSHSMENWALHSEWIPIGKGFSLVQ